MHDYDAGWDEEDAWWKANYASRPYAKGRSYDELRPAYFYGYALNSPPQGPQLG